MTIKCLILYPYPPESDGVSLQGHYLYLGLKELGVDAIPCHFKALRICERAAVVLAIGLWGAGKLQADNFTWAIGDFWFLPFGIIMFALNGISGVPLAREVLAGREGKLRGAIFIGTLIPIVFYLI